MKARLLDQEGPARARAMPYVVIVTLAAVLGVIGAAVGMWSPWAALLALASPLVAGLLPTSEARRREVTLEPGPGYVDVRDAGSRSQRITAKAVEGASTARTPESVLLTLSLARRSTPLLLEVRTEAEAESLRAALGVGHDGAGAIEWRPAWSAGALSSFVGRLMLAGIGVTALVAAGDPTFLLVNAVGFLQLLAAGVALTLRGFFPRLVGVGDRPVTMSAEGIRVWRDRSWLVLPYGAVRDVVIEPHRIVFATHERIAIPRRARAWDGDGLGDDAAEALKVQVLAAAARARGHGRRKEEISSRLDVLRRDARREHPRDWLARLDALAAVLAAGGGYRAQTVDPADLWAVVEDPDADGELRAGAARVLRASGLPEARVRIDAAVAATRDELTTERMRIAVEGDVDDAGAELLELEARQVSRAARPVSRG